MSLLQACLNLVNSPTEANLRTVTNHLSDDTHPTLARLATRIVNPASRPHYWEEFEDTTLHAASKLQSTEPTTQLTRMNATNSRSIYKERLRAEYKDRPYFARRGTDQAKANLCKLYELAGHCFGCGDLELMHEFLITPLREERSVLRIDDLLPYAHALEQLSRSSNTHEAVKPYLRIMVNELRCVALKPKLD